MTNKIPLNQMPWQNIGVGVKQKLIETSTKAIKLLRFDDNFSEKDWCTKGHLGYVVDGEMIVNFENKREFYQKGDGLLIESGHSHKAIIEKGKFVELFLWENLIK